MKEQGFNRNESGAALVTVLMITVLLSIACIGILSAAGSNSQNSTDVLSESKAYWAAESGLQSTINVLRNDSTVNYSYPASDPTLAAKITYNYPTSGTATRKVIGEAAGTYNPQTGTAYSVVVSDPDNTAAGLTFSTVGGYTSASTPSICIPNCTDASNNLTLSFTNITNSPITFPLTAGTNPLLSTLVITRNGNGATAAWTREFRINYTIQVGSGRTATKTVYGDIGQTVANGNVNITFDSNVYELMGSQMKLCQIASTNPCASYSLSLTSPVAGSSLSVPVYMTTTPAEPYRLKVLSTGYGPNGARKQLEGIIQKDFFNGINGPAAITMQGPGAQLVFSPGNSSQFEINGADSGGVVIPSVGVTDQTGLNTVINGIPHNNHNVNPAPNIVTDIPDWMATPQNLNALVNQLRVTAQNSGRYFVNPNQNLNSIGNYATGTGITFCEGDCTAGVNGGGILVVTGQLRNVGGWNFRGLIIVTGAEGWLRNGGGNGTISGNVVIAPYTAANLTTNTFTMPPKYTVTGGGNSDVEYDPIALDLTFSGTDAISDFMLGIAEK
jgi:Tfp pilus assembly protein PilX